MPDTNAPAGPAHILLKLWHEPLPSGRQVRVKHVRLGVCVARFVEVDDRARADLAHLKVMVPPDEDRSAPAALQPIPRVRLRAHILAALAPSPVWPLALAVRNQILFTRTVSPARTQDSTARPIAPQCGRAKHHPHAGVLLIVVVVVIVLATHHSIESAVPGLLGFLRLLSLVVHNVLGLLRRHRAGYTRFFGREATCERWRAWRSMVIEGGARTG
jgi:hypothetical protein